MAAGGNGRFEEDRSRLLAVHPPPDGPMSASLKAGGVAEQHAMRWTEIWLEGDNPDVDSVMDLERLR